METKRINEWLYFYIDKQNEMTIESFLDRFNMSKKNRYFLFLNQEILVNEQFVNNSYLLKDHDILKIKAFKKEQIDFKPALEKLDVVYEDDYILVVNKRPFQLVHPDEEKNQDTLCNVVANYYLQTNQELKVRHIHRIDRETSGLLMFCKCNLIMAKLDAMIANKEIKRNYYAWCENKFINKKGSIEKPIGRDRHNAKKYRISKTGLFAKTNYKVIKYLYDKNITLVECDLETGRTHQIRVHLESIGHSLLGDNLYGKKSKYINRLALHAYKLSFRHPITNKMIEIKIPLPQDMNFKDEDHNEREK